MGTQVSLNQPTRHQCEHTTALRSQVIRLHGAPHSRIPIRHHSLDNCSEANPFFPETFDLRIPAPASKNQIKTRETLS